LSARAPLKKISCSGVRRWWTEEAIRSTDGGMTIENGTEFVLAYVLVSRGVIITFGVAVFVTGWFVGRLHERRRRRRREE
jgi:hypothetical protein